MSEKPDTHLDDLHADLDGLHANLDELRADLDELHPYLDKLRASLEEKTAQRDRYRDALVAVTCAASLAEAVRTARDAFRDAGDAPIDKRPVRVQA